MAKVSVLIVEDDQDILDGYRITMRRQFRLFIARTVEEARQLLEENQVDVMVLDGRVEGPEALTLGFARETRPHFKGKMIATSADRALQKELMAAGCDSSCEKWQLPDFLSGLMNS